MMPERDFESQAPARNGGKLLLQSGRRRRHLAFEDAFCIGHTHLQRGEFGATADLFETLLHVRESDRPTKVMPASSEAGLGRFALGAGMSLSNKVDLLALLPRWRSSRP